MTDDGMTGPTLSWGEPVNNIFPYELQIVPGGAWFSVRSFTPNEMREVKYFMPTRALAEMQGLLNMLVLPIPVHIPEAVDGRRILAN